MGFGCFWNLVEVWYGNYHWSAHFTGQVGIIYYSSKPYGSFSRIVQLERVASNGLVWLEGEARRGEDDIFILIGHIDESSSNIKVILVQSNSWPSAGWLNAIDAWLIVWHLYVEGSGIYHHTIELYARRRHAILFQISQTVEIPADLIYGHCGISIKIRAQIAGLRYLAHAIYIAILDAYRLISWQFAEVMTATDALRASKGGVEDQIRIFACQDGDRGAKKVLKLCWCHASHSKENVSHINY